MIGYIVAIGGSNKLTPWVTGMTRNRWPAKKLSPPYPTVAACAGILYRLKAKWAAEYGGVFRPKRPAQGGRVLKAN
jgi:hypothetical protein